MKVKNKVHIFIPVFHRKKLCCFFRKAFTYSKHPKNAICLWLKLVIKSDEDISNVLITDFNRKKLNFQKIFGVEQFQPT